MPARAIHPALFVVLLAVAISTTLLWIGSTEDSTPPARTEDPAITQTERPENAPTDRLSQVDSSPDAPAGSAIAGVPSGITRDTARQIRIEVTESGQPAAGARLAMHTGTSRSEAQAAQRRAHLSRSTTLPTDRPGTWTVERPDIERWVLLEATAESGARRAALLAPGESPHVVRIDLDRMTHTVHIRALDGERFAPLPAVAVHLHRQALEASAPTSVAEDRTNTEGRTALAVDDPGLYFASCPDWPDLEPVPLRIDHDGPMVHHITLIRPEATHTVDMVITSGLPGRTRNGLYVRRLPPAQSLEIGIVARTGSKVPPQQAELPSGTYEWVALPADGLVLEGDTVFDVPRTAPVQIAVRAPDDAERTEVALAGIPAHEFPMRVFARPVDQLLTHRIDVPMLGPSRWSAHPPRLGPLTQPSRLVATGRTTCFVSEGAVHWHSEETLSVPMLPASELMITWSGSESPTTDARCVLSIEDVHGYETVRTLAARTSTEDPDGLEWYGGLVVPHGTTRVRCIGPNGETIAGARIEARGRRTVARLRTGSS
jgi:hypothetical protein